MTGWWLACALYAIGVAGLYGAMLETDEDHGSACLVGAFWPVVMIVGIINLISERTET